MPRIEASGTNCISGDCQRAYHAVCNQPVDNVQTKDDRLEREMAWALVQKYRGRARQLVLIERQIESKDRDSEAAFLRLVAGDALKLDAQWARRFNF